LFNREVDWQDGSTRLLFFTAENEANGLREEIIDRSVKAESALLSAAVNQLIGVAANKFAAIWLHAPEPIDLPSDLFGFRKAGVRLTRDLTAQPASMPNLEEGVKITKATMFCFRFIRELRFYL
jgi:hypothetical protein